MADAKAHLARFPGVGGFDASKPQNYLLPAFAAIFLGTAVVSPGQFNPMGTLIGIYFLATGAVGLQLLGSSGWVHDAFLLWKRVGPSRHLGVPRPARTHDMRRSKL